MSDEEFLILQVLNSRKTDAALAKSWMLVSKSIFPQSFQILFQFYKIEYDEKNLHECVLHLTELIKKFPNEIILIEELKCYANELYSASNDFVKSLFEELSDDIKHEVMLIVTHSAQSVEEHCKFMILFLKKLPDTRFLQHGHNITDTLLTAEKQPGLHLPINIFSKMLVCDILPLILKVSQFECKFKLVFHLLQKAVEFYIYCLFTYPTAQDFTIRKVVAMLSNNNSDEGWKPLIKLLEAAAFRYKWNYPEIFSSNFNNQKLRQLITLLKTNNRLFSLKKGEKCRYNDDTLGYDEAYFCLVVSFFYCLYRFGTLIHPKIFSNIITEPYNFVLMEGISCFNDSGKKISAFFKQSERGYFVIGNSNQESTNMLIPSFILAVECWELLHYHHHLLKDFNYLRINIKLETWPVFQDFFINSLICRRIHRDAIEYLRKYQVNTMNSVLKNKAALQIATCYNVLGDYEHCLKILFDIIMNLPFENVTIPMKISINKCPARYLYFMGYNNSEILQYCVSVLLKLYKWKGNYTHAYRDTTLGYTLVLMQYNVNDEYEMLQKCIHCIREAKMFCFPKFFDYIINIDILEEISYLATPSGGNVQLEILPGSVLQPNAQRAITRGINKEAKEELKHAFVNQLTRCYENLDNLFVEFIRQESSFLLMQLIPGM